MKSKNRLDIYNETYEKFVPWSYHTHQTHVDRYVLHLLESYATVSVDLSHTDPVRYMCLECIMMFSSVGCAAIDVGATGRAACRG